MDVNRDTFSFPSSDKSSALHACAWYVPGQAPRAIIQLTHGMSEHIARYNDFACHLVQRGFFVCGHDHIGHGKSVVSIDRLCCLPCDADVCMEEDINILRREATARFSLEGIPWFLFGHSMGSYLVRACLLDGAADGYRQRACDTDPCAAGLAGAILCGTGQVPKPLSIAGVALAQLIARARGADYRSAFLDDFGTGTFERAVPENRTSFDWLNSDPAGVDAYVSDKLCGVMFSVGGYRAIGHLTGRVGAPDCGKSLPNGFPILMIAGADDPVGNCGRGVQAVARALRAGSQAQVDVHLYPGMRHEILNEPRHTDVYDDVDRWLDEVLGENTQEK